MVVLEGAPKALDEDIVDRAAFAIHADPDAYSRASLAEQSCVLLTGELTALVITDDLGHRQLPDLLMQGRLLLGVGLGVNHWAITEHLFSTIQKLLLPACYLRWMQRMALGQFAQCLTLVERFQHHLRLKGRAVFAVGLFMVTF